MSSLIWFPNSRRDNPEEVTIEIRYLPNAHPLEQTDWGSWIDLYTYEDTILKQGDQKYINLGVSMKLPKGYEAILAPRSSKSITIPAGTRLCQFRIQKEQPKINFEVVDSLGTEDRGGMGSSGL